MAGSTVWVLSDGTGAAARVHFTDGIKCGSTFLQEAPLSIEVALESSHGLHTYATVVLEGIGSSWGNFRATLTANTTDPNACLALRLKVRWVLID